jgi:hypothetical protein
MTQEHHPKCSVATVTQRAEFNISYASVGVWELTTLIIDEYHEDPEHPCRVTHNKLVDRIVSVHATEDEARQAVYSIIELRSLMTPRATPQDRAPDSPS